MRRVHGEANNLNGTRTNLYVRWCHMIERCYNPHCERYEYYGGRGIAVCEIWRKDFTAFREWALANGYNEGLSLDRINNDGNYEPSNCRWVTHKEQCNNKRNNRILTYNGESKTISQWADTIGMRVDTLKSRIYYGWSVKDAIERPLRRR